MDTRALERIGLTKSEIAVYLALLRLGQTTAGPIVDESRVTRSKIYDILERLRQKGLVSTITRNQTKQFSAASPQALVDYLEKKEGDIARDKNAIKIILPDLLLQQHVAHVKKTAEVFLGIRGMENAFAPLIASFTKEIPYYAFGAGSGENEKHTQRFFERLHKEREAKKVKSVIIFNESARNKFPSQERSQFVEKRYLEQTTPAAINVYGDFVIIAILTKEPITLVINNREAADSFKEYCKTMWKLAKQ